MAHSKVLEKIRRKEFNVGGEMPFNNNLSLAPVLEYWKGKLNSKLAGEKAQANELLNLVEKHPQLVEPITDVNFVETYKDEIALLVSHLFPEMLQKNEIKAIGLPFNSFYFNPTERFVTILDTANEEPSLEFSKFSADHMYMFGCVFALGLAHGKIINFKRPSFFEIIDAKGIRKVYRVVINADYASINSTESSPEITDEDVKKLVENYDDIALWKEKFPPYSYDFSGFLLLSLIDVTAEQSISELKDFLLEKNAFLKDEVIQEVQTRFRSIFDIPDLKIGITNYDWNNNLINPIQNSSWESLVLNKRENIKREELFCSHGKDCVFGKNKTLILSDLNDWVKWSTNATYATILEQGVQSYIGVPLMMENQLVGLLEFGSPRAYELNTIVANKLEDISPIFNIAAARAIEEYENEINAIIQEQCTAVHDSVYWKFAEEAKAVLDYRIVNDADSEIGDIRFENVIPLFGQLDIKGSSTARNDAIQKDLGKQLQLAVKVFDKAKNLNHLPIFKEKLFRLKKCIKDLKKGLHAGDENKILDFLKREIYPVFNHLAETNASLEEAVSNYNKELNAELHMVYEERKKYEDSVAMINSNLSRILEEQQERAQAMFPHYFEKYKTDGVEFNAYIGQSIAHGRTYDSIYLSNLRLWQLEAMIEMEQVHHNAKDQMPMPLDVASLILVHGAPMSIEFRKDEKKFDVDGAYNARYEIIKKRIDKAHIEGTNERITVPGKIAIIYTNNDEAKEYKKYFEYLASQGLISKNIEKHDLEEVQGAAGLKALRISVIYNEAKKNLSTKTVEEIIEGE